LIDAENTEVTLVVERESDLSSLAPQITISPKATIQPASGTTLDFSSGPVNYTVTAEDESTKNWNVDISHALRNDAEVLSFSISSWQTGETVFDATNISAQVIYGTDLSTLIPKITISEGAIISPEFNTATDFSIGPVT
jgi:hypothetical protein